MPADRPLRLSVRTFWFPGWGAWVDGEETTIGVEEGSGAMLIDIPHGRHTVELRFTNTPVRTLGALISILTLQLFLIPYKSLKRIAGVFRLTSR